MGAVSELERDIGFWEEMAAYHRRQARIATLILSPNPRQLAEFQEEMRHIAELCERLATEEAGDDDR